MGTVENFKGNMAPGMGNMGGMGSNMSAVGGMGSGVAGMGSSMGGMDPFPVVIHSEMLRLITLYLPNLTNIKLVHITRLLGGLIFLSVALIKGSECMGFRAFDLNCARNGSGFRGACYVTARKEKNKRTED